MCDICDATKAMIENLANNRKQGLCNDELIRDLAAIHGIYLEIEKHQE